MEKPVQDDMVFTIFFKHAHVSLTFFLSVTRVIIVESCCLNRRVYSSREHEPPQKVAKNMTFRFVIFGAFLFLALIFVVAEESLVQTEAFSVETLVDLSVLQSKDMEFLQMAESSWQSLQTNEAAAVTSYAPLDYLNSSYVPVWMNNLSLDDESDIASNYIGCFPAKLGQPLSQQTSSPVYIPTNCWSRCKESKYYAIRDGTCFCGDTFGFDIKNNLVPDAVCRVLHGYSVGSPNGIAMYAVSHGIMQVYFYFLFYR